MIQHNKTAQLVDGSFICDVHSNELIDTVLDPTPSQVRKALLRDRKEVQKHRDLDRKQKRESKRSQAY